MEQKVTKKLQTSWLPPTTPRLHWVGKQVEGVSKQGLGVHRNPGRSLGFMGYDQILKG